MKNMLEAMEHGQKARGRSARMTGGVESEYCPQRRRCWWAGLPDGLFHGRLASKQKHGGTLVRSLPFL